MTWFYLEYGPHVVQHCHRWANAHVIHTATHVDHEKSCMVFDFYTWMWLCFYIA